MPRRARVDVLALEALAASQHRCVSLQQLALVGMPTATTAHRTRPLDGTWRRLLPGVVMVHRGTPTVDERASAALLYADDPAVLTGVESLRRWGLRRLPATDVVHVLIPLERRRVSVGFALCERTQRLPTPTRIGDFPCAPVARSLVDAARRTQQVDVVRAMLAEAVQRRLCPQQAIVDEVRLAQRRGTAGVRLVAAEIVGGVRSSAEGQVRDLLRRGGLPPALWNHDLFLGDEFIGCPDAWFDDEAVALEVDSREWHLDPLGWERTQAKRARFARFGITTVPITPSRMARDPNRLVRELLATLEVARSRPRPAVRAVMRSQAA